MTRLQGLVAVCCVHHAGHAAHALGWHEHAHTPLMALLGSPGVSAGLGAVALLGPGRRLLISGVTALLRCFSCPCGVCQLAAPMAKSLLSLKEEKQAGKSNKESHRIHSQAPSCCSMCSAQRVVHCGPVMPFRAAAVCALAVSHSASPHRAGATRT